MTPATLYTLHAEQITVQHGDTLPFLYTPHGSAQRLGTAAWAVGCGDKVTTGHLPLYRARKATGFAPQHVDRAVVYEDQWYYMSPDVQQLLELPVKQELSDLRLSNKHLKEGARSYREREVSLETCVRVLTGRIAAFTALPWYKRAWLALKGEVCA